MFSRVARLFVIVGALSWNSAQAAQLNSLFSENVVLQQSKPIPVWGTGNDGEKIEVKLGKSTARTTVSNGKWNVQLEPIPAGGPYTLTVTGENTLTVNNVLVGEVWVCGGQSNMERQLGPRPPQQPIENWEQEAAAADFPQVRMYFVPRSYPPEPISNAPGKWVVCSPQTAKDFSAVGFFFGTALHKQLKVPVGLIFTSIGGTTVEQWTSKDALSTVPDGLALLKRAEQTKADYAVKLAQFKEEEPALMKKYEEEVAAAATSGSAAPKKPVPPQDPKGKQPTLLFNGMVSPIIPYAIRGAIWYQGEANSGRGRQYRTLFPLMIKDWRTRWQQGDFPFCFVQLATYKGTDPMVREAQLLTLSRVPNTAMAVTTDVGDANDIHPPRKRPVGERLALAARAIAYKENLEFSGPLFSGSEIKDGKVTVSFTHAKGLQAKGGPLQGFTIAGADGKFQPGEAVIQGEKVTVSSPALAAPKAVRYNWVGIAEGNLFNGADLPASPFRTDVEPD